MDYDLEIASRLKIYLDENRNVSKSPAVFEILYNIAHHFSVIYY